jgi:hypothetical protein
MFESSSLGYFIGTPVVLIDFTIEMDKPLI